MEINYLKHMQKYLVKYKGKAIGVGDTIEESIISALETFKQYANKNM